METKRLGSTDLYFSRVGLGTWPIGGAFGIMHWGPQDDNVSIDTFIAAVNKGVNWVDTALYGQGHAEEVVGMAIKKLPNRLMIVTKCGSAGDLNEANVRQQCETSLKRMGIDVIDVYLVHWPYPLEYLEEAWQTCADLIKEGKVRYIGVSNFTVEQMDRIQPIHPIACMEPPSSMIERRSEKEIFGYCQKHNMGVITYSPLQQGVLTETLKNIDGLHPNDLRRKSIHFQEPAWSVNKKLVADLVPIARKYGCSVAALAIAWVLRRPEVTSAINGARSPAEIEDSVKGADIEISQEDLATIEELLTERQKIVPPAPAPTGPPGPPGAGPPGPPK